MECPKNYVGMSKRSFCLGLPIEELKNAGKIEGEVRHESVSLFFFLLRHAYFSDAG